MSIRRLLVLCASGPAAFGLAAAIGKWALPAIPESSGMLGSLAAILLLLTVCGLLLFCALWVIAVPLVVLREALLATAGPRPRRPHNPPPLQGVINHDPPGHSPQP